MDLPLSRELWARTGFARTDLIEVERFRRSSPGAQYHEIDAQGSMRLFWSLLQPSGVENIDNPKRFSILEGSVALPADMEPRLLETLKDLDEAHRWMYKPDLLQHEWYSSSLDDTVPDEVIRGAIVYCHLASARGFALLRSGGATEEAIDCLERGWRSGLVGQEQTIHGPGLESEVASLLLVNALVLWRLFEIKTLLGEPENALFCLALSLLSLRDVAWSVSETPDWIGGEDDEQQEREWYARLNVEIDRFVLDKPVIMAAACRAYEAAQDILGGAEDANWAQIARDCRTIRDSWPLLFGDIDTRAAGVDQSGTPWAAIWYHIERTVESRMDARDLESHIRQSEDELVQRMLHEDLIGDAAWGRLPERTQRALVDAVHTWLYKRAGRPERALSDLHVAVDTLCYFLLWEALPRSNQAQEFARFKAKDKRYANPNWFPYLSEYANLCRQEFFKAFVDGLSVSAADRRFLKKRLADSLENLAALRNPEYHNPVRAWERSEVTTVLKQFLGIGCEGVLPVLGRIYQSAQTATGARHLRGGRAR